jgi:hypothetical protein
MPWKASQSLTVLTDASGTSTDKPSATSFWLALGLVVVVTAGLHFYGLGTWSWGDDELASLIELRLLDDPSSTRPTTQVMSRLMPVWYGSQGVLLHFLPLNEFTTRLLSASCGILAVVLAFAFAARRCGLLFAAGLAVLLDGSQLLVWLSQQNRFYGTALLMLTLTLITVWFRTAGLALVFLAALFGALTVLSHNLLLVVVVLTFPTSCVAYLLGWAPRPVLIRSGAAALAAVLVYGLYLRPLLRVYEGGWVVGSTPLLVSFVAQAGVPTLALALFGAVACLATPEERKSLGWWLGFAAAEMVFVLAAPWIVSVWSARYALLFMAPLWVLAAYGMQRVARALGSRSLAALWYVCVGLLLLPKLISHYQDGTRHDFRQAAELVKAHIGPEQEIYSMWAANLCWYLPEDLRPRVRGWDQDEPLPAAEGLLVYSSTVWQPLPQFPGRHVTVLGEIRRRRFDEQSHVLRVYHVSAAPAKGGL